MQASVTPTIFYLEENGHLTELIDADFRFADAGPESTAKFTLNGQQYSVQIPPRKSFGEERVQIDVPAWTGSSNARIDLSSPHKLFRFPLTPAKKWTVFVVPHTHIDVGYTDFQGKVAEDQARSLDDTLKLIHDNPDFRFSPDGSWAVEQFLNTRSGDQ